jgi:hypothetical protein
MTEDVLDVVRRYLAAFYPGSVPRRLDVRFLSHDGEQLIRLPIPLTAPVAATPAASGELRDRILDILARAKSPMRGIHVGKQAGSSWTPALRDLLAEMVA